MHSRTSNYYDTPIKYPKIYTDIESCSNIDYYEDSDQFNDALAENVYINNCNKDP